MDQTSGDLPPAIKTRNDSDFLKRVAEVLTEAWDSRTHHQAIMTQKGAFDLAEELVPGAIRAAGGSDDTKVTFLIDHHGLHHLVRLSLDGSGVEPVEISVNARPMGEVSPMDVYALLVMLIGMARKETQHLYSSQYPFAQVKASLDLVYEALDGCRVCGERFLFTGTVYREQQLYLCFMASVGERGDPGDASIFSQFEVPWTA